MMLQRNKRSRLKPVLINKFENKIFRGTKYPRYQPETASALLMKYFVEVIRKDKQNHLLIPLMHFSKVLQQQ